MNLLFLKLSPMYKYLEFWKYLVECILFNFFSSVGIYFVKLVSEITTLFSDIEVF